MLSDIYMCISYSSIYLRNVLIFEEQYIKFNLNIKKQL